MTNDNPAVMPGHIPQSAVEAQEALEVLIRLSNVQASGALTEPVPVQPPSRSVPTRPISAIRVDPEGEDRALISGGPGGRHRRIGHADRGAGYKRPVRVAAREVTPGALNSHYDVPRVRYDPGRKPVVAVAAVTAVALVILHHALAVGGMIAVLVPIWGPGFVMRIWPLMVSLFDRPFTTDGWQDRILRRLRVVVAVPVYNEDPALLDRCLWALVNQSRPPDTVHVVEDGPSVDYSGLRAHWSGLTAGRAHVQWTRLAENGGKKVAQSAVFTGHPEADIFVTVDSDTTLDHKAIEEGLKPFADERNMSVAGIEENFNKGSNWLSRSVAVRNTYYQLTVWAAQSVFGDLLVNRGTFALYRAWIIREIVPAYIGETFLGRRIKLGDDAALTLFSQAHGRTVQQLSAFSLPMHPDRLSHHFRQWTRWARGAVIRNCWRLRYLPVASYGFWWTVMIWYMIFMSGLVPVVIAATWPQSEHLLIYAGAAVILWTYLVSVRTLSVRRSGESAWFRCVSLLMYPMGILWATLVLRPVRLFGITTFMKQRWTTRQAGVEEMTFAELGAVS